MKENFSENIVIGNGIMAKQLMFKLKNIYSDITCISSENFAPACSHRTTAVTCLRGTKRDVSPLGNLIIDSYDSFENFFNEHKPVGVSKSIEVQTWLENGKTHEKWLRRYGAYELTDQQLFNKQKASMSLATVNTEAYLVSPEKLYSWYDEYFLGIDFIDGFVIGLKPSKEGYDLYLKSGETYSCKRLFLCTSYMTQNFADLCIAQAHKASLLKQKPVYGNYLHYKLAENDFNLDLSQSFCLSYEFIRMTYRKESHDLVISFPDVNKDAFIGDANLLKETFGEFKNKLGLSGLPKYEQFVLKQGIRCKGHQRIPFCEEINKNLFCASGLYKNAFTFAYLFSEKITDYLGT